MAWKQEFMTWIQEAQDVGVFKLLCLIFLAIIIGQFILLKVRGSSFWKETKNYKVRKAPHSSEQFIVQLDWKIKNQGVNKKETLRWRTETPEKLGLGEEDPEDLPELPQEE